MSRDKAALPGRLRQGPKLGGWGGVSLTPLAPGRWNNNSRNRSRTPNVVAGMAGSPGPPVCTAPPAGDLGSGALCLCPGLSILRRGETILALSWERRSQTEPVQPPPRCLTHRDAQFVATIAIRGLLTGSEGLTTCVASQPRCPGMSLRNPGWQEMGLDCGLAWHELLFCEWVGRITLGASRPPAAAPLPSPRPAPVGKAKPHFWPRLQKPRAENFDSDGLLQTSHKQTQTPSGGIHLGAKQDGKMPRTMS